MVFLISSFRTPVTSGQFKIASSKHDIIPLVVGDQREFTMCQPWLVGLPQTPTGKMVVLDAFSRANRRASEDFARRQAAERDALFRNVAARSDSYLYGRRFRRTAQAIFPSTGTSPMNGRRVYIAIALITAVVASSGCCGGRRFRGSNRRSSPRDLSSSLCVLIAASHELRTRYNSFSKSKLRAERVLSCQIYRASWAISKCEVASGLRTFLRAITETVRRWMLKARLETIKTGDCTIPPLDVRYSLDDKSTTLKSLSSKPLPVRITSVLESQTDLRKFNDIKDAVDVAVPELLVTRLDCMVGGRRWSFVCESLR